MKKRYFWSQLITLSFQAALYLSVFVFFFLPQSITNPQIISYSRTAAITLATFTILLFTFTNVYGGYQLGVNKVRSLFYSIWISVVLTDLLTYIELQIMNVNPANNPRLMLFGEDFLLLCCTVVLQGGIIYLFVKLGDYVYFKINRPERCCIIAASQEQADHVSLKVDSYPQKYQLCDVLHYHCDDLFETILEYDTVFLSGVPDPQKASIETFCYKHGKFMYLAAELEDVIISSSTQVVIDDTPFLFSSRMEPTLMQRFIKRLMDITISAAGLILLSPLMAVAAVSIKSTSDGPVFFWQERATLNGRIFKIVKFRTMFNQEAGSHNESALDHDSRITKTGHFLRKYRIDELPQLYNVLKGDMSIVGPRPEMLENIERYTRMVPEFKYRQKMKAGLTGLAQIDGKYNTSPKDKLTLDLHYIGEFSLSLDVKLILRTITVLFRHDSSEGFPTHRKPDTMPMRIRPKVKTDNKSRNGED